MEGLIGGVAAPFAGGAAGKGGASMPASAIESYALLGDTQSAALVARDGSIDWLCLPRFDSGACFAALVGEEKHGRWRVAPRSEVREARRAYRPGTLVLETIWRTGEGSVRLIDFMPPRVRTPDVVRIVEGLEGEVPIRAELVARFDYGSIVPWVRRREDGAISLVGGPDALLLSPGAPTEARNGAVVADFSIRPGQRVPFVLAWHPSYESAPAVADPEAALEETTRWWERWSGRCTYRGPWREAVVTSLCALKALTYAPTGGLVAAATTSLPESPGGVRNWDYRFCWLRDATFTLSALTTGGYREEAAAWRDWLLRAAAGDPARLQVMYGVLGERRLTELDLPWLPGYRGAAPVRAGNGAVSQRQLDVYGELMDALYVARRHGLDPEPASWQLQRALLDFLEGHWRLPDHGLWEVRSEPQDFTHSKVMAWVAFDRAIAAAEEARLDWPLERWRRLRDSIHHEVCRHAWSERRQAFTRSYGSSDLDASLLLMPEVGFLPASDPRVRATVAAIERELCQDGLILRYRQGDGLPAGEGAFLACSFWLADAYALMGREREAREVFEHLLSLRNDVGLLSEEYDPVAGTMLGNFPQAFSHVGLVNTAYNLTAGMPAPLRDREPRSRRA